MSVGQRVRELASGAGSGAGGVAPVVSGLVATRRGRWLSAGAVVLPVALVVVACGTGVGAQVVSARESRVC